MEPLMPYGAGDEHINEQWRVAEAEWGRNIQDRTFQYALRIIGLYRHLKTLRDDVGTIIGKQLLRSGTSVGANVSEARSAQSRADYAHKLSIALKEARESLYWLRLLKESGVIDATRIGPLLNETDEIIAVLTTIVVKLKQKP